MTLVGGGFFGFLIATVIISVLLFLVKAGFNIVFYFYANYKYDTSSLSSISDINKLKSLLDFWSQGKNSDSKKVEKICDRILKLYPSDLEAKICKVVFSIFHREYNYEDKLIFESLYSSYKEGVDIKYNDDMSLSVYLYAYYCSKNNLPNLCKELLSELNKFPDYKEKLETYIQEYPVIVN
jgi:hypothetical protein